MNNQQDYNNKNKRKELRQQFQQIKTYMGVYKITNLVNGKIYIATASNLKNKWQKICDFQFNMGKFTNLELQKDWNELGVDAFTFEVIEEKEVKEDIDVKWELKKMEKNWMEKLQPYGDKGYNHLPK